MPVKIGDSLSFMDSDANVVRSGTVIEVNGSLYTVRPARAEANHGAGVHPRKRLAVCRGGVLVRYIDEGN